MRRIILKFNRNKKEMRVYTVALFHFIDYILRTPPMWQQELFNDLINNYNGNGERMMAVKEETPSFFDEFLEYIKEDSKNGLQEGREQGIEQGSRETALNIATGLIKESFQDGKIAEFTKLQ